MERKFIDLYSIYGDVEIKTNTYTIKAEEWKEDSSYGDPQMDENYKIYTEVGKKYMKLIQNEDGFCMMSDHPHERITNQNFINAAKGDVVIFGLGIGLIILPLLEAKEITSILVVEKDKGLIDSILPTIKKQDTRGILKVVHGDAFNYFEELNVEKFDTIYFDIWQNVDQTAYNQMMTLHKAYYPFLRSEKSFMDSWLYYTRLKVSIMIR